MQPTFILCKYKCTYTQVEADILNEVEDDNAPRTKSKKNKSRRKEGGSRRRKTGGRGSEEGARRRQEGGLGRSGFLDEELRLVDKLNLQIYRLDI